MYDDCFLLELRLGESLVFVRDLAAGMRASRGELRRLLEDARDMDELASVVQDLTGELLAPWDRDGSREAMLGRAADALANSGCCVLVPRRRRGFSGRSRVSMGNVDLDSRIPMLSDLGPREPLQASPQYCVELEITTDDGVAIADAQFEVKNTRGFAARCKSDGAGRVRTNVPLNELYTVCLLADIVVPPLPTEVKAVKGIVAGRQKHDSLEVSVNHRHVLVVARPRAKVVSIDRWVEARPVLMFGTMSQTDHGPTTVRGALRRAFTEAGAAQLHVVGHADTEGKAGDNEALALERARSMHLYLAGDRLGWADHAFAHADVATLQAALVWAAASCGLSCDPGPIDSDWGPATSAGLTALRDHAGIDQSQQLGPDDWAAIFDLYDDDLGRILLTDREGVASARGRLNLATAPTTMGERWPVDAPELSDHECPDNRRVDLVICGPGTAPAPDTDELYDGTFARDQLVLAPEQRVRLFVHNVGLVGLAAAQVEVRVGGLVSRRVVADASGLVIFTVLHGDSVRVCRAARSGGSGSVVAYGLPEAWAGD